MEENLSFEVAVMNDGTPLTELRKFIPNPDALQDTERNRQIVATRLKNTKHGLSAGVPMACFLEDAPVLMANGCNQPIASLKVGDRVITHEGRAKTIVNTMQRSYTGRMYGLSIGYNRDKLPLATNEHPFLVKRFIRNEQHTNVPQLAFCPVCGFQFKKIQGGYHSHLKSLYDPEHFKESSNYWNQECRILWIPAAEIDVGDFILSPRVQYAGNKQDNSDIAIVLGYYLAEGCYEDHGTSGICVSWTFHYDEVEYVAQLRRSLANLGFKSREYERIDKTTRIVKAGADCARLMLSLGNQKCDAKELAEEIFSWQHDDLKILLKCYLNGDGYYRKENNDIVEARWTTTSYNLDCQLAILCNILGYEIGRNYSYKSPGKKRVYERHLNRKIIEDLFDISSSYVPQPHNYVHIDDHGIWYQVKAIDTTEVQDIEVFNIEVEGDHSYCVDSVAVHNCKGPDGCPYSQTCPLVEAGMSFDGVIGSGCPLEKYYLTNWSAQLSAELQLDPDRAIDKWAAMDIVKWMVLENRALELLKIRPSVTEMQIISVTQDGDPVEQEIMNPLIEFVDRCERAIQRSLKTLNATREMKAKTNLLDVANVSELIRDLKDKSVEVEASAEIKL
jgi:hypothetical protein